MHPTFCRVRQFPEQRDNELYPNTRNRNRRHRGCADGIYGRHEFDLRPGPVCALVSEAVRRPGKGCLPSVQQPRRALGDQLSQTAQVDVPAFAQALVPLSALGHAMDKTRVQLTFQPAEWWMTENLDVAHFRNGDPIPEAVSPGEWKRAGEEGRPGWCHYNNDPEMAKRYGKLYNWHAVNDARGLAPEGWRVPTRADFERLASQVGEDGNALKSEGEGRGNGAGTNTSGFPALMAGCRNQFGEYEFLLRAAWFWTSTEAGEHFAHSVLLGDDNNSIHRSHAVVGDYKHNGYSVRCVSSLVGPS